MIRKNRLSICIAAASGVALSSGLLADSRNHRLVQHIAVNLKSNDAVDFFMKKYFVNYTNVLQEYINNKRPCA